MNRTRFYPWVCLIVLIAAAGVIQVGVQGAADAQSPAATADKATSPTDAAKKGDDAAPTDTAKKDDDAAPADAEKKDEEAKPPEPDIALAFKDASMEQICKFIEQKLNKPVIPHDAIKGKKITIISSKKYFLPQALHVIHEALRQNGVIIQEYEQHIEFLPIEEARHTQRRVVGPDESAADVVEKAQIVDKVFRIEHYDVLKLKELIAPMLPKYGFVAADANISTLVVTDTVANIERIEAMVARLDVPMADQTTPKIIKVLHGDASQIVAILRPLIGAAPAGKRGRPAPPSAGAAPVILTVEVSRNWIIAVASAPMMKQIERWVAELDKADMVDEPFDLIEVKHAEIQEVASQIVRAIESMPGQDIKSSTRVVPFVQSRRLLVFGSSRGRDLVKDLLAKLDVETSQYQESRDFVLKHADADTVAEKIESLFSNVALAYRSRWGSTFRSQGPTVIKVTADKRRNSVTVMTDPIRMKRVEEMIKEQWDLPLDTTDVQPRIYPLMYADPIRVKDLLEDMFTAQRNTSGPWWNQTVEENNPVGRLTGQFTFQAMEESNMLIVTTKTASNYTVIDELIKKLDTAQIAGLPRIIELKHANAEDLAEQLNAMLSETGTPSQIRRSQRNLSTAPVDNQSNQGNNNTNNNNQGQPASAGDMQFWWSSAQRRFDQRPISNLIGMPRFVPINRRNALMILAPEAYIESLTALIDELDQPGLQVVIHAIIAEVQHDDVTTLGLRVAADPSILSDPGLLDSAIAGSGTLDLNKLFGGTFTLNGTETGRGVLGAHVNLNVLVQALIKKVDLEILFETRLYTADNQEAESFDGQDVPVLASDQRSTEGATNTRKFNYQQVGTRLRIRPHITKDGDVDLTINLVVSRTATGESVFGNPVFDRRETTTHVIVGDSETIMISGIVKREDFSEERKFPLLGDIPLAGKLFRSTNKGQRNREMIVFITPRVIRRGDGDVDQLAPSDRELLKRLRDSLGDR